MNRKNWNLKPNHIILISPQLYSDWKHYSIEKNKLVCEPQTTPDCHLVDSVDSANDNNNTRVVQPGCQLQNKDNQTKQWDERVIRWVTQTRLVKASDSEDVTNKFWTVKWAYYKNSTVFFVSFYDDRCCFFYKAQPSSSLKPNRI